MESEILTGLKDEILETVETLRGVSEVVKAKNWKEIFNIIPVVIKEVEILVQIKDLDKACKRELAILVLNAIIDLPIIGEKQEAWLIGYMIDAIIAAFNTIFGKKWIEKKI